MKIFQHEDGTYAFYPDMGGGYDQAPWTYIGELPEGVRSDLAHCVNGEWVEDLTSEWDCLRKERDRRLSLCDWAGLEDCPDDKKELWRPYRTALRNITQELTDPRDVVWPDVPEMENLNA